MCATRLQPKLQAIELDFTAAFDYERGIGRAELLTIASRLDDARRSLLASAADGNETARTWPQRCLADYKQHRKSSQLGRTLHLAKQLRDAVDRVVVLGPQPAVTTTGALFAACCHPYHNELSRGERGGRPRIYFLPAAPDNDLVQAMLETLPRQRLLHSVEEHWGIVALDASSINESQSSDFIDGLFLYLWEALQSTTTADEETQLAAVVGSPESPLVELARAIGIEAIAHPSDFRLEFSRPGGTSDLVFQPSVLLVSSIMGIDIVNLLRGAAAMSERFVTQPVGVNPVLDLAGLQCLLAQRGTNCGWRMASSVSALKPLAQCLHPRSDGDHLLVQWIVENQRHDRLQISMPSGKTLDGRPKKMDRPLAEVACEQLAMARNARAAAGQPTAVVRLPTIDEASIGQLVQMFSLASAIGAAIEPEP
jgi:glucose-6-phosphate isomerase